MQEVEVRFIESLGCVSLEVQELNQRDPIQWRRLRSELSRIFELTSVGGLPATLELFDVVTSAKQIHSIGLEVGIRLVFEAKLDELINFYGSLSGEAARRFREDDVQLPLWDESLDSEFSALGWQHDRIALTLQQQRDVARLLKLKHGAIFSVPGSGKTTVAFALHQLLKGRSEVDTLLVVAPRNAFGAWDEAIEKCLIGGQTAFTRLQIGHEIPEILKTAPRYSIITYQQAMRLTGYEVQAFVAGNRTHLVLDESHRIKRGFGNGADGRFAKTVFDFGVHAVRRDVLSGTPMPQSTDDLIPQFEYLYPTAPWPGIIPRMVAQPERFKRFYVRTTAKELGIPTPIAKTVRHEMGLEQAALYKYLMKDMKTLKASGINSGKAHGGIVRVMQAAIDPKVAAEAILRDSSTDNMLEQLCLRVIDGGVGARIEAVIQEARSIAAEGKKVVVWAPYVKTIEKLHDALIDLGSQKLWGRELLDDDEVTAINREELIRRFKEDEDRFVLVANPAAGGEGISLHQVCHHAIYVGRTFDAAQWLQSRDRINRLGMPEGVIAQMTIHESKVPKGLKSIDDHIAMRLSEKVAAMAKVLEDETLHGISLEYEGSDYEDGEVSMEDIQSFFDSLDV